MAGGVRVENSLTQGHTRWSVGREGRSLGHAASIGNTPKYTVEYDVCRFSPMLCCLPGKVFPSVYLLTFYCWSKIAPDKVKQARKTLFKATAIGERNQN